MKMLTHFDYPKYMILQRVARFELDICGQTGRKLWITIYDEVSGHGFVEDQSDLFLEAFIEEFRVLFGTTSRQARTLKEMTSRKASAGR